MRQNAKKELPQEVVCLSCTIRAFAHLLGRVFTCYLLVRVWVRFLDLLVRVQVCVYVCSTFLHFKFDHVLIFKFCGANFVICILKF